MILEELSYHVGVLLDQLHLNQFWGVTKDDSLEVVIIHKLTEDYPQRLDDDFQSIKHESHGAPAPVAAVAAVAAVPACNKEAPDDVKVELSFPAGQLQTDKSRQINGKASEWPSSSSGLPNADSTHQQDNPERQIEVWVTQSDNAVDGPSQDPSLPANDQDDPNDFVVQTNDDHHSENEQDFGDTSLEDSFDDFMESEPKTKKRGRKPAARSRRTRKQVDVYAPEPAPKRTRKPRTTRQRKAKEDVDNEEEEEDDFSNSFDQFGELEEQDDKDDKGPRKSKYPMERRGKIWQCLKCPLSSRHHSVIIKHCIKLHFDYDYQCPSCPMKFKTDKALQFHTDYIHNNGSLKHVCPHCGRRFSAEQSLRRHQVAFHDMKEKDETNLKSVKCNFCLEKFPGSLEKLQHQVLVHKDQLSFCNYCSQPFDNEPKLVQHVKAKHDASTLFTCNLCGKEFFKEDSFAYHQDDYHEDKDFGIEKNFVCNVEHCQKRFRRESFLGRHAKFHISRELRKPSNKKKEAAAKILSGETESSPCAMCGVLIPATQMSAHLMTHNKSLFKCGECGKGFPTTSKLKYHNMSVHVRMELKCPIENCTKVFFRRDLLRYHIRCVHTNREMHSCDECTKSFAHKSDLREHKRGVHEGRKCYCAFCGKDFVRSSEKNRHERQTHKNEKLMMEAAAVPPLPNLPDLPVQL